MQQNENVCWRASEQRNPERSFNQMTLLDSPPFSFAALLSAPRVAESAFKQMRRQFMTISVEAFPLVMVRPRMYAFVL